MSSYILGEWEQNVSRLSVREKNHISCSLHVRAQEGPVLTEHKIPDAFGSGKKRMAEM